MSTLKIEINLDNAAFEDPDELPRILKRLASRIEDGDYSSHALADVNGNTVGMCAWFSRGEADDG